MPILLTQEQQMDLLLTDGVEALKKYRDDFKERYSAWEKTHIECMNKHAEIAQKCCEWSTTEEAIEHHKQMNELQINTSLAKK